MQRNNKRDTTGTSSEPHLEAGQHGVLSRKRSKRQRDGRDITALGDTQGSSPLGHKYTTSISKKQRNLTDFLGTAATNTPSSGTGSYQLYGAPILKTSHKIRGGIEEQDEALHTTGPALTQQVNNGRHILEPPNKGCIRFMHINTGGINPQAE